MASASGVSQTARRWTVRPPSRRSAAAATRTIASRSSPSGSPKPTTSTRPAATSPPFEARAGREPRALQLPELVEPTQLAARPPVELAERPVKRWVSRDRDDEDVRGNVPRLIGDDTKLHGRGPPGSTTDAAEGAGMVEGELDASVARAPGHGAGDGRQGGAAPDDVGESAGSSPGSPASVGADGSGLTESRAATSLPRASSIAMTAPFIPP